METEELRIFLNEKGTSKDNNHSLCLLVAAVSLSEKQANVVLGEEYYWCGNQK